MLLVVCGTLSASVIVAYELVAGIACRPVMVYELLSLCFDAHLLYVSNISTHKHIQTPHIHSNTCKQHREENARAVCRLRSGNGRLK